MPSPNAIPHTHLSPSLFLSPLSFRLGVPIHPLQLRLTSPSISSIRAYQQSGRPRNKGPRERHQKHKAILCKTTHAREIRRHCSNNPISCVREREILHFNNCAFNFKSANWMRCNMLHAFVCVDRVAGAVCLYNWCKGARVRGTAKERSRAIADETRKKGNGAGSVD